MRQTGYELSGMLIFSTTFTIKQITISLGSRLSNISPKNRVQRRAARCQDNGAEAKNALVIRFCQQRFFGPRADRILPRHARGAAHKALAAAHRWLRVMRRTIF